VTLSTASLEGARDHARAQAATAATATSRTIPASAAVGVPSGIDPSAVVWDETVAAGNYASQYLPIGTVMRIADDDGDACVHLVVHNAAAPYERINVADTVKVQWQAFLGPGAVLLSDMGRALMTVIGDTSARHDALCGTTSEADASGRYGSTGIHAATPTVRQLLTVAAAKHGLDERDLPCGVNLFKSVTVDDDGGLHLAGDPAPGTATELRADMDVLVFVANVPHPLDVRPAYTSSTVRVTAWRDESPPERWRRSTPERQRAYENTDDYLIGRFGHAGRLGLVGR
jgi:urea carboxylase-associated protein 2